MIEAQRLRELAQDLDDRSHPQWADLCRQAADELERLRAAKCDCDLCLERSIAKLEDELAIERGYRASDTEAVARWQERVRVLEEALDESNKRFTAVVSDVARSIEVTSRFVGKLANDGHIPDNLPGKLTH